MDALSTYLEGTAGMLFTAIGHTSALVAGPRGLFHFDSAVAAERSIIASMNAGVLTHAHRIAGDNEYCVTVVRTTSGREVG